MGNGNVARTPIYTRAYLSVGFREVLFPIDVGLLLKILPQAGYALEEEIARATMLFGGRISVRGDNIARKGDFRLALNSERGFIGIDSPDPQETTREFSELQEFLEEKLALDIEERATFFEFLAQGSLPGNNNPLQIFASVSEQVAIIPKLSQVLETEVGLFGLRLASPNQDPNQPDWFELYVEPLVEQASRHYSFSTVFRRRNREPVIEFARGFSQTLLKVVSLLERS